MDDKSIKREWRFLQCNVQGSRAATGEIPSFLADPPDIIILSEPYLVRGKVAGLPTSWTIVHREGGRAAIACTNKHLRLLIRNRTDNVVAVEVSDLRNKVIIISFYFSPKGDIERDLMDLSQVLDSCNGCNIIVAGDCNARHSLWDKDSDSNHETARGEKFLDFIFRSGLVLCNRADCPPTFQSTRGQSRIDITLVSSALRSVTDTWKVHTDTASDHNYISYSLEDAKVPTQSSGFRLTTKGLAKLARSIGESKKDLQELVNKIDSRDSLEEAVGKLTSEIQGLGAKFLKSGNSQNKNPWWDNELRMLRSKTRALRKRYQRTDIAEEKGVWRTRYNRCKAIFKRKIVEKKRKSWDKYCEESAKTNVWGLPYKIAAEKVFKPVQLNRVRRPDGQLTADSEDTINAIVDALFPKDDWTLDTREQRQIRNNTGKYTSSTNDPPFTRTEIGEVIKSLCKKKAPGLDGIKMEMIRTIHGKLPGLLVTLMNKCLSLSHFPRPWKVAKLILFNKQGKPPEEPRSYRPICLLSTMGKVLDKLIAQRIQHHYLCKNLLNPAQHGFRAGKSCETAHRELMAKVMQSRERGEFTSIISLDVQGAFDTVWWPKVLDLLAKANCPKNVYDLVTSYFSDREIVYDLGAKFSHHSTNRGCPQGSCSGPLFWNLVADEGLGLQGLLPEKVWVQAYADDLIVIVSGNSTAELETRSNRALELIKTWGDECKLTFNPDKMSCMTVNRQEHLRTRRLTLYTRRNFPKRRASKKGRKLVMKRLPTIRWGGAAVKGVSSFKYLGVVWDRKLSFEKHFKSVGDRILKLSGKILRVYKSLIGRDPEALKRIYKGSIERIAVFGHGAWSQRLQLKGTITAMEKMVRPILIGITRSYQTVSTPALYILAGVMPLDLQAIQDASRFLIKTARERVQIDGVDFDPEDYEKSVDIGKIHPAKRTTIPFDSVKPTGEGFEAFTDGSGLDGRKSAGLVVLRNGQICFKAGERLRDGNSVFQSELAAIEMALEWVSVERPQGKVSIHSDSLSSLQALSDPNSRNQLVNRIKDLYSKVGGEKFVELHYIRAHVGNYGNELADEAAKEATQLSEPTLVIPFPQSLLKNKIRTAAIDMWQDRWDIERRGRHTYRFCPKVSERRLIGVSEVAQVVTGHGRFPAYFKERGMTTDGLCRECQTEGDALHYLTVCRNTRELRRGLAFEISNLESLLSRKNEKSIKKIVRTVSEGIPVFRRPRLLPEQAPSEDQVTDTSSEGQEFCDSDD